MWNGRDPKREITFDGATFGSVEHWSEGILTRGVLLDVPRHRGVPSVTHDRPVHGWELEEILAARGLTLAPGDAVAVYCGRETWQSANPETPTVAPSAAARPPGRGSTCRACRSSGTTTWRSSCGTCSTTCRSATTSRGRCTRRSSPTACRSLTTRSWSRSPARARRKVATSSCWYDARAAATDREGSRRRIRDRRNWGRWGKDDQLGRDQPDHARPSARRRRGSCAPAAASRSAARFPRSRGRATRCPAQHYMRTLPRGTGGFAADYYGIFYHGSRRPTSTRSATPGTRSAMWNGRDPQQEITFDGATFGSVEHWRDGIITRGRLARRAAPSRRALRDPGPPRARLGARGHPAARAGSRSSRAMRSCVYCGREAWQAANPETPYGRPFGPAPTSGPGCTSPACPSSATTM